jgi:triosephosphate isomerase
MRLPAIVLNFKTYPEILGKKGWDLAQRFAAISDDTGASIVLCPPATDVAHVAKLVHLPVFAQHVDAVEAGQTTGWSPPESLLEAGAAGTLINHSERKVAWEEMAKSIPRCQKLGLEVVACADDIAEAETLAKLSPEYIAIEPPELIGGDVSVTTAKPEVVSRAVDRIRAVNPNIVVLCGAGVHTRKDVSKAIELGTSGVLLATGVVKAKDPESALRDLIKGLPSGAPRRSRSR